MLIGHHTVANLAALHHTRTLVPDAQNRIYLSEEILEPLDYPWGFSVNIDGEKRLDVSYPAIRSHFFRHYENQENTKK